MPTAEQMSAASEEPENTSEETSEDEGGVELPLETETDATEEEIAELESQAADELSKEVPTGNPEKDAQTKPTSSSVDLQALIKQNQELLQQRYDGVIQQQNSYLQQLAQQNQQLQQQLSQLVQAQQPYRPTENLSPEEQAKLGFIDELKTKHLSPEVRKMIEAEVGPLKEALKRAENERFAQNQKAIFDNAMQEVTQHMSNEVFKDLEHTTYDSNFVRDMEDLTLTFAAAQTRGNQKANFEVAAKTLAKVLDTYHKARLRTFAKSQASKPEARKQPVSVKTKGGAVKHEVAKVQKRTDQDEGLHGSLAQQLEQAVRRMSSEFNA